MLNDLRNTTYNVTWQDSLLFVTSIGFDLSCYDIFGSLAAGSTIHLAPNLSPEQLFQLLVKKQITFWDSAPQVLQQLEPQIQSLLKTETCQKDGNPSPSLSLRLVFLSGDWIPLSLVQTLRRAMPNGEVVALGGATEVTVWSNSFEVEEVDQMWRSIPYGRPIWNHQYYCLRQADQEDLDIETVETKQFQQLNHLGMTGELYIGGVGVAQGYIARPELTHERFLVVAVAHGFCSFLVVLLGCFFFQRCSYSMEVVVKDISNTPSTDDFGLKHFPSLSLVMHSAHHRLSEEQLSCWKDVPDWRHGAIYATETLGSSFTGRTSNAGYFAGTGGPSGSKYLTHSFEYMYI